MVSRIERPRSRLCVFLLGIAFLLVFIILLGIGDGAPDVLLVQTSGGSDEDTGKLTYRVADLQNVYTPGFTLSRENQLFWMDLRLGTGDGLLDGVLPVSMEVDLNVEMQAIKTDATDGTTDVEQVASYNVQTKQFCAEGAEYCDYFFLLKRDFVDRDRYDLTITFPDPEEYVVAHNNRGAATRSGPLFSVQSRVTSINPEFTRFEIAFKYLWLVTTLFVMFCPCGLGFMSALRRKKRDTGLGRTFHQKWTATLLWALVWFDDPFVAATVYTNWAKLFSAVFILSASIFVFLILLFWLCFLSDIRFMQDGEGNARRGVCYWVPKVILTLAIGTTVLGGYMYYRFENTVSFDYTGVEDEKKAAEALAVVLGLLLAVYMLWALVLGLRSCGGLRKVSPSYVLLYAVTLLACLVAVIGVFVAAYYPYSTSGVAFVGIHGLLNLYIWSLALSFAPVRSVQGMGDKEAGSPTGRTSAVTGTGGRADRRGGRSDEGLPDWTDPADGEFKAVEL